MIPPLKIKCTKKQYRQDGTCGYMEEAFDDFNQCLKHNCIYYDGEQK